MAEPAWWAEARRLRWKTVWDATPALGKWRKVKRSYPEIAAILDVHPKSVMYALNPRLRARVNRRKREEGINKVEWFNRKLRDTSTELPKDSPLNPRR